MSALQKYTYRHLDWVCSVEFFPDRMEYFWDVGGFKRETARKVFLRSDLSPHLNEYTGPSIRFLNSFRMAGIYLILAMLTWAALPDPWRNSTWLFLALFVVAVYRGTQSFRHKHWFQIVRKNGGATANVLIDKWTEAERKEFQRFYAGWISEGVLGTIPDHASK
jgi:hypothetical protein